MGKHGQGKLLKGGCGSGREEKAWMAEWRKRLLFVKMVPAEVQSTGGPGAGRESQCPPEDPGRVCPVSCSGVGVGQGVGEQRMGQEPLTGTVDTGTPSTW